MKRQKISHNRVREMYDDLRELQKKITKRSVYVHYQTVYQRRPKHRRHLAEEY